MVGWKRHTRAVILKKMKEAASYRESPSPEKLTASLLSLDSGDKGRAASRFVGTVKTNRVYESGAREAERGSRGGWRCLADTATQNRR